MKDHDSFLLKKIRNGKASWTSESNTHELKWVLVYVLVRHLSQRIFLSFQHMHLWTRNISLNYLPCRPSVRWAAPLSFNHLPIPDNRTKKLKMWWQDTNFTDVKMYVCILCSFNLNNVYILRIVAMIISLIIKSLKNILFLSINFNDPQISCKHSPILRCSYKLETIRALVTNFGIVDNTCGKHFHGAYTVGPAWRLLRKRWRKTLAWSISTFCIRAGNAESKMWIWFIRLVADKWQKSSFREHTSKTE